MLCHTICCDLSFHRLGENNELFKEDIKINGTEQQEEAGFMKSVKWDQLQQYYNHQIEVLVTIAHSCCVFFLANYYRL